MIMIIKYENNMYKWEKLCAFFHVFIIFLNISNILDDMRLVVY